MGSFLINCTISMYSGSMESININFYNARIEKATLPNEPILAFFEEHSIRIKSQEQEKAIDKDKDKDKDKNKEANKDMYDGITIQFSKTLYSQALTRVNLFQTAESIFKKGEIIQ